VKGIRDAFHPFYVADLQLDEGIREVAPCNLICDVHYVLSAIPSCLRMHLIVTPIKAI